MIIMDCLKSHLGFNGPPQLLKITSLNFADFNGFFLYANLYNFKWKCMPL